MRGVRPKTTSRPGRHIRQPGRTSCSRAVADQMRLFLLADVGPAHVDAAPLAPAGCAVRYAVSDQAYSAHRGDDDANSLVPAEGDTESCDLHAPADAHAAP